MGEVGKFDVWSTRIDVPLAIWLGAASKFPE
jgi:hypothetical protein